VKFGGYREVALRSIAGPGDVKQRQASAIRISINDSPLMNPDDALAYVEAMVSDDNRPDVDLPWLDGGDGRAA
jgi:hypothetical protein